MLPRDQITAALRDAPGAALVGFITAGYPTREGFIDTLRVVSRSVDAVEVGVPFSDPMADGVTVQRSSEVALRNGVTLEWILAQLRDNTGTIEAPVMLMSYLNPLLAYGYERLAAEAAEAGVSGFIVPDLPFEECGPLRNALDAHGLALIQFVTPATPKERIELLCKNSQGFVYAVTRTGITGGRNEQSGGFEDYLDSISAVSPLPVCAGFGVRAADQVELIGKHADGVIVGSALVEVIEKGEDPTAFLRGLRP